MVARRRSGRYVTCSGHLRVYSYPTSEGHGEVNQDVRSERQIPRSALLTVNRALTAIHSAVGLRPTLEAIADGVTVSTPFQDVAVTVAEEPNAAELRAIAVIGPPDLVAKLLNTTCQRTALVKHLAGGEAWGSLRYLADVASVDGIPTYTPDYEPLAGPDAWQPEDELAAPLYGPDGELIGMLSMDRPRDGRIPPAWVIDVLELFAEQAAIAILNARRHEEALRAMQTLEREKAELHSAFAEQRARETHLRHEARSDPLTGLANRVELNERLQELIAAQTPVTVLFCDLDHFKEINDTHGHAVGDKVLRVIGPRLAEHFPDAEVVARIGGDEFVVVLRGARKGDTERLLRRVDKAFAGEPVYVAGLPLQVTSSVGLVREPDRPERRAASGRRVEELLSRADREMYAHKRSRAAMNRLLTLAETHKPTG
jgi:diguanylate cyclase (GGDEF)-like protein